MSKKLSNIKSYKLEKCKNIYCVKMLRRNTERRLKDSRSRQKMLIINSAFSSFFQGHRKTNVKYKVNLSLKSPKTTS